MKKFDLLNNNNRRRCGKALLAASLLLVTVGGVLRLPSVQAAFFPGSYHAIEFKSIRQLCVKIEKRLITLRADLAILQRLAATGASSSLQYDPQVQTDRGPGWQVVVHETKQARVSVLQKLNYINATLNAMEGEINRQIVAGPKAVTFRYIHPAQTLRKIALIRARCRKYQEALSKLWGKVTKLIGPCD